MKQRTLYLIKKVLKLLFVAAAFSAIGVYLVEKVNQYNTEGAALMQELFEMNTLLAEKDTWDKRASWVEQSIPRFDTQKGASHFLLHNLKQSSAVFDLQLRDHDIHPRKKDLVISSETLQKFDRATVDVTIKGREQDIVRWIHDLQTPGNFTGVDKFTIEIDDYGLRCDLQVSLWYLGNNRSLDPFQHHETEIHDLGPSLANRL